MQTTADIVKPKPARKASKPRNKFDLPADEYLRLDPVNEKAVIDSCRAAERGELLKGNFDAHREFERGERGGG